MRYFPLLAALFAFGCEPPQAMPLDGVVEKQDEAEPEAAPEPKKGGISLGNPKFTSKIGEFDPNADREVSSSKGSYSNPITGALEMYGPTVERMAKMKIESAVRNFQALNGYYPRDYEEFMERIIKQNHIKLPVLPRQMEYQYDVENHKLVVVRKLKK
ncbi:MAG: hypothetical protein AB8G99_17705 [Planctomycetaceae bacterium]